ncbi:6-phosphogluconolactonase [Telmatospirillum siberiense]|uniref:6-phosphogluconolactonase n=2 Tax=Telmatospirillum siberiense TaxID=382514 RepID=A0A2N3PRU9_9PROT|nr:6-phosphogluconolactonase [Telmatospirillum siberiense]
MGGQVPAMAKTFVYVSNAEDGDIDGFLLDKETGSLSSLGKTSAGKAVMPMTVSPDKKFLYASVRSKPFNVVTYAIDPSSGALSQKASAPLPDSMAYISIDATGRFLFTASYGGDKIAVNPIDEAGLARAEAIQVVPTGHNAHSIRIDASNKFVYATNLGSDQILQFRFDAKTGKLSENKPALIKEPEENGPRHIIFSPDQKNIYVSNELSGNVFQFSVNKAKGTLKAVGDTASMPAGSGLVPGLYPQVAAANAKSGIKDDKSRVWSADLKITPNGRFLYVSERTRSKISLLSVAPGTGRLTYVTEYPTETQPRGIGIDPTGTFLIASGEKSDRLAVYRINQTTGELTLLDRYPAGKGANWVEIVDLP